MHSKNKTTMVLKTIYCQLFAVYMVEKWIAICLKGCRGEDLTFLTCVYLKMREMDAKMRDERDMGRAVGKEKMG